MGNEPITITHEGTEVHGEFTSRSLSRLSVRITHPYQNLEGGESRYVSFSSRPDPRNNYRTAMGLELARGHLAKLYQLGRFLDGNWERLVVDFVDHECRCFKMQDFEYEAYLEKRRLRKLARDNAKVLRPESKRRSQPSTGPWERLGEIDQKSIWSFCQANIPVGVSHDRKAALLIFLRTKTAGFRLEAPSKS